MLYGSETTPVRKENVLALAHAKIRMFRWMCGVHQIDRYSTISLRYRLGLEKDIISILRRNRFRWYEHVLIICLKNHSLNKL